MDKENTCEKCGEKFIHFHTCNHIANTPVMCSVCECVYEYNDDHHPLLVYQCQKCEEEK